MCFLSKNLEIFPAIAMLETTRKGTWENLCSNFLYFFGGLEPPKRAKTPKHKSRVTGWIFGLQNRMGVFQLESLLGSRGDFLGSPTKRIQDETDPLDIKKHGVMGFQVVFWMVIYFLNSFTNIYIYIYVKSLSMSTGSFLY